MTARIDLADLERYAATYRSMREAGERGTDAVREALPALIAAVRALREIVARVDVDIASGIEFEQSSEDAALEKRARAALAAFDFKEETK